MRLHCPARLPEGAFEQKHPPHTVLAAAFKNVLKGLKAWISSETASPEPRKGQEVGKGSAAEGEGAQEGSARGEVPEALQLGQSGQGRQRRGDCPHIRVDETICALLHYEGPHLGGTGKPTPISTSTWFAL